MPDPADLYKRLHDLVHLHRDGENLLNQLLVEAFLHGYSCGESSLGQLTTDQVHDVAEEYLEDIHFQSGL